MWVIPKNLQLSAFVPDTVESKEDLNSLESELESSLMWRSKPSRLRTWSLRWKRVSWLRLLFTRILKPSQQATFVEKWTSSLEDIHANPLAYQENDLPKMTPDTCGRISSNTSEQLTLFDVSGRTSTATSIEDSKKCCPTWKQRVTEQNSAYSQRVKSVQSTKESESLSWPTPTAHIAKEGGYPAEYNRNSPSITAVMLQREGLPHSSGKMNPEYLEWMMGVPTGWTELGCWGTE